MSAISCSRCSQAGWKGSRLARPVHEPPRRADDPCRKALRLRLRLCRPCRHCRDGSETAPRGSEGGGVMVRMAFVPRAALPVSARRPVGTMRVSPAASGLRRRCGTAWARAGTRVHRMRPATLSWSSRDERPSAPGRCPLSAVALGLQLATPLCSPNPATRVLCRVPTGLARHRSGQTLAGSWPGISQGCRNPATGSNRPG